jgi:hypothetical protein
LPPSSDGASVRNSIPAGLIAGPTVGALLLAAAAAGAVFLFRYRSRRRGTISDSADVRRELEFVDSTLHETLVTYSDSITVEGVSPIAPEGIFIFPTDASGVQSLI